MDVNLINLQDCLSRNMEWDDGMMKGHVRQNSIATTREPSRTPSPPTVRCAQGQQETAVGAVFALGDRSLTPPVRHTASGYEDKYNHGVDIFNRVPRVPGLQPQPLTPTLPQQSQGRYQPNVGPPFYPSPSQKQSQISQLPQLPNSGRRQLPPDHFQPPQVQCRPQPQSQWRLFGKVDTFGVVPVPSAPPPGLENRPHIKAAAFPHIPVAPPPGLELSSAIPVGNLGPQPRVPPGVHLPLSSTTIMGKLNGRPGHELNFVENSPYPPVPMPAVSPPGLNLTRLCGAYSRPNDCSPVSVSDVDGLRAELDATVRLSVGSVGHPHACSEACRYVKRKNGCRDGDKCRKCHLCFWRRQDDEVDDKGAGPHAEAAELSLGTVGHPHRCGEPCKYVRRKGGCRDGPMCRNCHSCLWQRQKTEDTQMYGEVDRKEIFGNSSHTLQSAIADLLASHLRE